ncbi:unnamed protein product [Effrenium voratum]|nr:unnamed protein product [Effrenium voratum]
MGKIRRCDAGALWWLREGAGGRVDQRTLRFFVTACAKGGMMDKAIACFQSALLEGLAPDFQSYSALVRGLCAAGQLDQATYFFYMMLEKGHRPDGLLADALLECCVSQSHLPLVEKAVFLQEAAVPIVVCALGLNAGDPF